MKSYFLLSVSAAALSIGAGLLARHRSRRAARSGLRPDAGRSDAFNPEARQLTRRAIQFFVVPVWTAAGVADWWCHRASDIEHTAGAKESLLHLLMLAEAGVPITAGLLLEIDPLVLSVIVAAFFLHEATAMWDVSYAVSQREVTPLEQHVHSFLEMVPLMATMLVSLLHWPQLKALLGLRVEPLRPVRPKAEPLDRTYVATALASMVLIEVLPYLEELIRDLRAGRSQLPHSARMVGA